MNPQRDKGQRAEREACRLLHDLLGVSAKRRANEGIREDIGDLVGVPSTTVQVASYADVRLSLLVAKAYECQEQQTRHGERHGVTLARLTGGRWGAICTRQQMASINECWDMGFATVGQRAAAPEVLRLASWLDDGWLCWRGTWLTSVPVWAEAWREAT